MCPQAARGSTSPKVVGTYRVLRQDIAERRLGFTPPANTTSRR